MNFRLTVVSCLVLGALACGDAGPQPLAPDGERSSMATSQSRGYAGARQAELLAPAIAAAMKAPAVRTAVRDAMRASLLTEHKLDFQEFMASSVGRGLLSEAARITGHTVSSLEALVAALPPADFYMPAEQHRLSWQGTGELMVAAMLTETKPTIAYRPDGGRVNLDFGRSPAEYPALFLLQYSEPKDRRVGPQPNRSGLVIQDAGDGRIGGVVPVLSADGNVQMKQLADVIAQPNVVKCPPEQSCGGGGGGGGGGPPPPPPPRSTFLDRFETVWVEDGTPWEGNEFEFRAVWDDGFGGTRRLYPDRWPRLTGVLSSQVVTQDLQVVDRIPNGATIKIPIVETDAGTDDNYLVGELQPRRLRDIPVKLFSYHNGQPWALWREGYGGNFPYRNTASATFKW